MIDSEIITTLQKKYEFLSPMMDERLRRRWAATEANTLGWGGISAVAQATGLSRTTIHTALRELESTSKKKSSKQQETETDRIRKKGGGRKRLSQHNPRLLKALETLVDSTTRGDPQCSLRWTCKSTRNLADELVRQGYSITHTTVAHLLEELGFSLQANRKTREGKDHPDRNAQFEYIAKKVRSFQKRHQPVISVDTKKKELVGDFKNAGREWRPRGQPEEVRSKDFPDKELGKTIPYGVYDLQKNEGWVNVGIDRDTAEFATESIFRWWQRMGSLGYPSATELLITADSGGSNSSRSRLWKVCLQDLADQTRLKISVCHFPPGTSKWNKIEHRMFCHITENWRGRPLISRAVVVNLIGNTKTRAGLRIEAALDMNTYETGIKISDEEFASIRITKAKFHGDWNYTIAPI